MKIVLATNNKNKISELNEIISSCQGPLRDCEIVTLREAGYYDDPDECGMTFAENARIKALAAVSTGNVGIGDDSGLAVDALDGAPGVFSARYAGGHGNHDENNAKLLRELENVADEDRSCRFVCSMCCVFPNGDCLTAEECVEGRILREPRGTGGFGYDCLFYVEEYGKTMAEMTMEEKNKISHRGMAMRQIIKKLNEKLGQSNDKQTKSFFKKPRKHRARYIPDRQRKRR